jgi:hypothetical protein
MAQRQRSPLRIISRLAPPEPRALDDLMAEHGLFYDDNPSFDCLAVTGRGSVIGITAAECIVVGSWEDASVAMQLVSAGRLVYVIDQAEVRVLVSIGTHRRVRDLIGGQGLALVFTDADVRDALLRAGLFGNHNAGASVPVLPTTLSRPEWQRIAARLLEGAESG